MSHLFDETNYGEFLFSPKAILGSNAVILLIFEKFKNKKTIPVFPLRLLLYIGCLENWKFLVEI